MKNKASFFCLLTLCFPLFFMSPLLAMKKSSQKNVSMTLVDVFPKLSFDRPLLLLPSGTPQHVLVVQQDGMIYEIKNNFKPAKKNIFLDIRKKVSTSNNEEGLLGVALHPQFSQNKKFYLYYSAKRPRRSIIAEYTYQKNDNAKVLKSEKIILQIPQPFGNHNGGTILFGPDGYLYMAIGDGGSGGDPFGHSQNLTTLLGTILRIDVNSQKKGQAYIVPQDNPFVSLKKAKKEIFAYGLRNPWRMSFDQKTGELFLADVGQNKIEEINIIQKGGNYGWNYYEGNEKYLKKIPSGQKFIRPIHTYTHKEGASITGGHVYRGKKWPALQGYYIYGDFVSGKIWGLKKSANGQYKNVVLMKESGHLLSSFGVDQDNEIYICSFSTGKIYTIGGLSNLK